MTAPTIRLARREDAAALAKLAEQTFCETFVEGFAVGYSKAELDAFLTASYAPQRVADWIDDPLGQVLVAEMDRRLIAYAQAGDNSLPCAVAKPGDGELKRIYVSRAAQGLGLGRELLERSLEWLGQRPIFIGVWIDNHKAQRLYGHYGFKRVGEHRFAVGETLDEDVILARF